MPIAQINMHFASEVIPRELFARNLPKTKHVKDKRRTKYIYSRLTVTSAASPAAASGPSLDPSAVYRSFIRNDLSGGVAVKKSFLRTGN